jgi:hypothetical protein
MNCVILLFEAIDAHLWALLSEISASRAISCQDDPAS